MTKKTKPALGRPPLAAGTAKDAVYKLRLTQAQRAKLEALGGAAWLRERIERAKEVA
jgi:hypothetical protein